MDHRLAADMADAVRLVRAGELSKATTLIQRVLNGQEAKSAEPRAPRTVTQGEVLSPDAEAQQARRGGRASEATKRSGLGETLRDLAARARRRRLDRGSPLSPRPARPALPEGASFATRVFRGETGTREYKLYIPAQRPHGLAPLVVMLHGCTQTPDDFAAGTRMNKLAEEQGFLVAYPCQTASANPNRCWNWFRPEHQRRGGGEPAMIAGITRVIMEEERVDTRRVYVAGLSAGGAAAAIMAEAYPELYAAIGIHSGLAVGTAIDVQSAFAAMRRAPSVEARSSASVPTIVFHGDRDTTVHQSNGDEIVNGFVFGDSVRQEERGRSPGGRAYSRTTYVDAAGRSVCEDWRLHGAGHAWSGGDAAGSYVDPTGPDASREMLRFFLQHRRD